MAKAPEIAFLGVPAQGRPLPAQRHAKDKTVETDIDLGVVDLALNHVVREAQKVRHPRVDDQFIAEPDIEDRRLADLPPEPGRSSTLAAGTRPVYKINTPG